MSLPQSRIKLRKPNQPHRMNNYPKFSENEYFIITFLKTIIMIEDFKNSD